jgi:hypothetical protein
MTFDPDNVTGKVLGFHEMSDTVSTYGWKLLADFTNE